MAVLLVLHEIADDEKCAEIKRVLRRRHGIVVNLTQSALALYTPLLPVHVFDAVKEYVDVGDRLFVIPLAGPYTGYAPRETTEWLSNYLVTG